MLFLEEIKKGMQFTRIFIEWRFKVIISGISIVFGTMVLVKSISLHNFNPPFNKTSEPSCSKLTMSLVNVSLKL